MKDISKNIKKKIIPLIRTDEPMIPIGEDDLLDILPLKNMVIFPGVLVPITVARPKSLKIIEAAFKNELPILTLTQHDKDTADPDMQDLYTTGVAARVLQVMDLENDAKIVILEGRNRLIAKELTRTRTGLKARVGLLPEQEPAKNDREFTLLVTEIKEHAIKVLENDPNLPPEAKITIKTIDDPHLTINYTCCNFPFTLEEKMALLQDNSINERAYRLLSLLNKYLDMLSMRKEIQSKAQEQMEKQQRDYYLHQQLESIQKELGDTQEQTIRSLRQRGEKMVWKAEVKERFEKEVQKLSEMSPHSPDYQTQESWLDTMLNLPWDSYTTDNYDLQHAREVLDADHFGMDKVKERILEFLVVQKLLQERKINEKKEHPVKSPILCLYGPPGVGKTSLGRSIASALGRKYVRVSLGGLHDESELRGHRRTYIGAMPGRIIDGLKRVKSGNPVFMLDEIDKVGSDYKGDPTAALLEILDPEQNSTFHDNYLDIDYDLSQVTFIATANTLESIPRPLLDRMELIEMTGYSQEEKTEIAKRHLMPKVLSEHGLKASQLTMRKDIIRSIIDGYTRESGVRSLERQLATICRKVDTLIATEKEYNKGVTEEDIIRYLGQPRYSHDSWETNAYVGVVTGLAWTQVGGEILFIECALSPAKTPTLTLTGNLGDVMKESATIAMGYIRAHAEELGITRKKIDSQSVHIHVPEGATPKDGPSAGITITTALVSAFTGRKVKERIAMTGEMTLRGKVLPIGGLKEKLLAAKRAQITDIVLCEDNRKDVAEIPAQYLKGLTLHFVRDIHEVIDIALCK